MLSLLLRYVDPAQLAAAAVMIGIFGTTGLLMILMMRRARHVNAYAAARRREAEETSRLPADPAIEEWDEARGQYVPRDPAANPELLRQGARARQTPGFLDP